MHEADPQYQTQIYEAPSQNVAFEIDSTEINGSSPRSELQTAKSPLQYKQLPRSPASSGRITAPVSAITRNGRGDGWSPATSDAGEFVSPQTPSAMQKEQRRVLTGAEWRSA